MGSSQSSAEASVEANAAKLLGDEILSGIISELQHTIAKAEAKYGTEKTACEKRTNEIIILQQKFTEYRRLVEEAKDEKIERISADALQLQNSLEEYKQKFDKINKAKQDLEQNFNKKTLEQQRVVREWNEKFRKVEKELGTESGLRKSLEKEVRQMKTLKSEFEAQTKKITELERELNDTKVKFQNEMKLKQELETKVRFGADTSGEETRKILRDTIEKQSSVIKQVQENLISTQHKLNIALQTKQEESIKLELEKQLSNNLKREKAFLISKRQTLEAELAEERIHRKLKFEEQERQLKEMTKKESMKLEIEVQLSSNLKREKEYLISKLQTIEAELVAERTQSKLKFKEQEKQLKEMTQKVTVTQINHKQQVKLRRKAQADLLVLEEKNSTIKQLEAKVKEKDTILMEYLTDATKKPEEGKSELEMEIELSNFLKKGEEALIKELRRRDLEQQELKFKQESNSAEQLKKFNNAMHRLRITQKNRDQQEQLRKETEGKLNLLEITYKSLKGFCERELRERKDFLEEFERLRQQSKTHGGNLAEAKSAKEQNSFLQEKIELQMQLDRNINEIASLKQQLKLKETEMKSMACKEQSNSKREEMSKLHEEFMENLKKFNQN